MRLRFSVRDLLWLTLVVAMGLGWLMREWQLRELQIKLMVAQGRVRMLEEAMSDQLNHKAVWLDPDRVRLERLQEVRPEPPKPPARLYFAAQARI